MRQFLAALVLLLPGLAACGGGGGDEPSTPSAPGVLRTLALQGETAPGTSGAFSAFETDPPMDVASGGWSIFVAGTTDAAAARCAYVAQPNGDLLLAFRAGETVPGGGTGTIADFDAVWITPDGSLLAKVSIAGDDQGRTQGLLSAQAGAGTVADKAGVLFDGRAMTDIGLSGTLQEIRHDLTAVLDAGWVFVPVVTDAAEEALLRVALDGTGLEALIQDGDSVPPGGSTFAGLEALEIDPAGARYVFVAERDDASRGVYVGVVDPKAYGLVLEEGDDLSSGVVVGIPSGQPLLIDNAGRVLFKAVSSEAEDHLCAGVVNVPPSFLAVEGDIDDWSDGAYQDLDWIRNQRGGSTPFFMAELGTNPNGITFGIFLATDLVGGTALAMWNTREVPAGLGANLRFTSTFPGLARTGRQDADSKGSLAFANVLNNGQPGAFWLLPNRGLFTIAAGGQTLPGGGGTFDGLSTWRTTTANDVMLFRAPVSGGRSGIFRRGP